MTTDLEVKVDSKIKQILKLSGMIVKANLQKLMTHLKKVHLG